MEMQDLSATQTTTLANNAELNESTKTPESPLPTRAELEAKPWKHVGYKGYARFLSSDDGFLVFRKFGTINARIMLWHQFQLSQLEEELDRIDQHYSSRGTVDTNNGCMDYYYEDRIDVLERLSRKASEYNTLLLQQSQLQALRPADKYSLDSIRCWHGNHSNMVIVPAELRYLDDKDDLVCVSQKDRQPIRRYVDSSGWIYNLWDWVRDSWSGRLLPLATRRRRSRQKGNKTDAESDIATVQGNGDGVGQQKKEERLADLGNMRRYSDRGLEALTSLLITTIGAVMLITPLWILRALEDSVLKLWVITAFILACLLIISFIMVARPFEALGVSAAYAAVLMVFLQVGPE